MSRVDADLLGDSFNSHDVVWDCIEGRSDSRTMQYIINHALIRYLCLVANHQYYKGVTERLRLV